MAVSFLFPAPSVCLSRRIDALSTSHPRNSHRVSGERFRQKLGLRPESSFSLPNVSFSDRPGGKGVTRPVVDPGANPTGKRHLRPVAGLRQAPFQWNSYHQSRPGRKIAAIPPREWLVRAVERGSINTGGVAVFPIPHSPGCQEASFASALTERRYRTPLQDPAKERLSASR